ncbi:MAG: UDP-N-acetylmuramate--L-alanine ligase [Flavobacteriia bacterium]|nr:UDP-N-acetylmuramate--L-alanine ligase [Flavobacteriia bacterium]
MKELSTFTHIYFIGIGGIGMSALARYFNEKSFQVLGYDKTPSSITDDLIKEGIKIHFEDLKEKVVNFFPNKESTLVIYTPAIPKDFGELLCFQKEQFHILKRAQVLGLITLQSKGIAVAGTHGKTTTSTMLSHILHLSHLKCSAFLGGISSNYNSNYISSFQSEYTVIEADEFDKSFLQLRPFAAIITSTDPDHLDIYGNSNNFLEGFQQFANLIDKKGLIMLKKGLNIKSEVKTYTYSVSEKADYMVNKVFIENGKFYIDIIGPDFKWEKVELGLPGIHNAENALATVGVCLFLGLGEKQIRNGLNTFKGVKRRFEYQLKEKEVIYIDDYAHHPTEINALFESVKLLYPNQKITAIFQPHLFSRTRDFLDAFAKVLSLFDNLLLLPIYPARELPIEGVNSDELLKKCTNRNKFLTKNVKEIETALEKIPNGVFLTIGAGDIDRLITNIKTFLLNKIDYVD